MGARALASIRRGGERRGRRRRAGEEEEEDEIAGERAALTDQVSFLDSGPRWVGPIIGALLLTLRELQLGQTEVAFQ